MSLQRPLACSVILLLGLVTVGHAASVTVDADLNSFGCASSSPGLPFTSVLKDTEIDINVGDLIIITTSGTWWDGGGSDPFTDANGHTGLPPTCLDAPIQALLGQINDLPLRSCEMGATEKTFFVGTNFSQVAQASGRLFLAFCDTDYGNNQGSVLATITVIPASTCEPDLAQCQADLTQCLASIMPDNDGDGVPNSKDSCPDTPPGVPIDQAGCSLDQFCSAIEAKTLLGKKTCRKSDWKNDEPLMTPREADCKVAKGVSGQADDRCVPAAP